MNHDKQTKCTSQVTSTRVPMQKRTTTVNDDSIARGSIICACTMAIGMKRQRSALCLLHTQCDEHDTIRFKPKGVPVTPISNFRWIVVWSSTRLPKYENIENIAARRAIPVSCDTAGNTILVCLLYNRTVRAVRETRIFCQETYRLLPP